MKIKNNKKSVVILRFSSGGKFRMQKIKGGQEVDIPLLSNVGQVVNKFLFRKKTLSVLASSTAVIAPKKEKPKAKKTTTKEVVTKASKKSEVEEAIESADNFVAGDVNKDGVVDSKDLSIVHKAYSKSKKDKNK